MSSLIHAVVVHHRSPGLTSSCLDGLAEQRRGASTRVVATVVDAGPEDGSLQAVQAHLRARGYDFVTTMAGPGRPGLGAALNVGLARPLSEAPELVLILHPDTRLREGALAVLQEYLHKNPGVGIVGPRYVDAAGAVLPSAFRFPSVVGEVVDGLALGPVDRWLHAYKVAPPMRDEAHQTDWLGGAALLIRAEVLEATGPMDEAFFLHFGDVDLCRRALAVSWTSAYVPRAEALHTPAPRPEGPRSAEWYADRQRYFDKHHGEGAALLADVALGATSGVTQIRRRLQGRAPAVPGLLRGLLRHRAGQLARR